MKQLALASFMYGDTYDNLIPVGWWKVNNVNTGWWVALYEDQRTTAYLGCPDALTNGTTNIKYPGTGNVQAHVDYTPVCESTISSKGALLNDSSGGTRRYLYATRITNADTRMFMACFPGRQRLCPKTHSNSGHNDVIEQISKTPDIWPRHNNKVTHSLLDGHVEVRPIEDPLLVNGTSPLFWY